MALLKFEGRGKKKEFITFDEDQTQYIPEIQKGAKGGGP